MKLVDVPDSKSGVLRDVSVRLRPPAFFLWVRAKEKRQLFQAERQVFVLRNTESGVPSPAKIIRIRSSCIPTAH
jgi:hypothetical protein